MIEKNFKCDKCGRTESVEGKYHNDPKNWVYCDAHMSIINATGSPTRLGQKEIHICDNCHSKEDPYKEYKPDIEQLIEDLVLKIVSD